MKKDNFKFHAEIIFETEKIKNVLCEIFFPKSQTEKVIIKAQFDISNNSLSEIPFVFSLSSFINDFEGNLVRSISANKVYNLGIETSYYSQNLVIAILTAEPVDLKIRQFIKGTDNKNNQKNFYFWLTQSIQLAPYSSRTESYNGNVSINTVNQKSFEIIEGLEFNFINYYFYSDEPEKKNTRISESVLAADFNGTTEHELGECILPEIDLFLKLVSFSERRRIVCYGYKGFSGNESIEFYRGDISIPEENFAHSHNETLIDNQDFHEFISQCFISAKNCIFKDYLFDAIGKTSSYEDSTVESDYLRYYSALENLVNGYRETHGLCYILENEAWTEFKKDLKRFIKKHNDFKNEPKRRDLIYQKIPELNRISFSTAFKSFCDFYQIDLSDLWMIVGGEASISLPGIRNRLIHGGKFEREEYEAIICASSHLKWALERCILRVLGWDVERSKVNTSFLKYLTHYNEWKDKIKLLRNQ